MVGNGGVILAMLISPHMSPYSMKADAARSGRITRLYDDALKGKFQEGDSLSYTKLVNTAKLIGVTKSTAEDYADDVIARLKKGGYLK